MTKSFRTLVESKLEIVRESGELLEEASQTARLKEIYQVNRNNQIGNSMERTEYTDFDKNTRLIDKTNDTIVYGSYTGSALFINEINSKGRLVNKMSFKGSGLKGLKKVLK